MNSLVRIMNKDIIKKAIFWQILYIVIYGFCAVIINIYFTDVILFVYGIEKNDVLIPTCGFGDYLYYAMWISGIHSLSESIQAYIFGAFMIFVGIIIQCVVIKKLSIRDNFKGFPGTVFPFLGTVLAYLAVQMVV